MDVWLIRISGETTDDDDVDALKQIYKDVGSIKVEVRRANIGEREWLSDGLSSSPSKEPIAHKVFKGSAATVSARYVSCMGIRADIDYIKYE